MVAILDYVFPYDSAGPVRQREGYELALRLEEWRRLLEVISKPKGYCFDNNNMDKI